jgi:excisionase family DNA binding protein
MTIPATAREIGSDLPSADDKAVANHLRRIIAESISGDAKLRLRENDKTVDVVLTPGVSSVLMDLLRHIGRGDAVTLVPVGEMLTTQQAADILNVSRPFLISLLEREKIAHTLVGRHRRIRAKDLFAFKNARDEKRGQALADLAALDADLI